jgi:hypothetical protein
MIFFSTIKLLSFGFKKNIFLRNAEKYFEQNFANAFGKARSINNSLSHFLFFFKWANRNLTFFLFLRNYKSRTFHIFFFESVIFKNGSG